MSKAITEKKYYRVPDIFEKSDSFLSDLPCGAWCTDKLNMQEVEKMNFYNEVMNNDKFKCISGKIIDESINDCCIFIFHDEPNFGKDEYIEVTWDELMKECTPVEVIVYE